MGLKGRCMCGAIRYELESDPFDAGWCHCRTCQQLDAACTTEIEPARWVVDRTQKRRQLVLLEPRHDASSAGARASSATMDG